MARVPYVDGGTHPDLAPAIASVRAARRGKLIPVYGLLLHSPEVALNWMSFINAARWQTTLSSRLRELVILRVAILNGCRYVVDVHRDHFAAGDGLSLDECDALEAPAIAADLFAAGERDVIAYVDALTREANVDDATFTAVKTTLGDRAVVELSVLIGAYNMHTRVMNALRIDPELAEP